MLRSFTRFKHPTYQTPFRASRFIHRPQVRTNFTTTDPTLVWLSETASSKKRLLFTVLVVGIGSLIGFRLYRLAKRKEHDRSVDMESGYERSFPDLMLSFPANYMPTSTFLSKLPSGTELSSTEKLSLHLLLLQTIRSKYC